MSQDDGMSLVDHLSELRKRIIWTIIVLVLGMVIGVFFANPIITYLKSIPPANGMEWNAFSPWDPLKMYMNFALVIGLLITLPFTLYQVWAFLKPGLREIEQRAALMYVPFAFIMFLAGLFFGYYVVFTMAFLFTTGIAQSMQLSETYGIAQYFGFMFSIIIPIALVFELPIVVMFLTKIRILNPAVLRKVRKLAYMGLVVVSTLITPPDAISAIIVAIPMILLYEFSIYLSNLVYRKQQLQDAQWEKEQAEEKE
ncbi:twin-arginine translocase subunit TatC [Paenibacillus sp. YYML68]|uniref:twin-arginine translocase subunit TatC n=1 Tax=Paenibacillus sp. YYML68 TaxID=2909250 RepID=UPI0024920E2D|nr:twin-arginine translocase subunit TatC [Paenibacillus sp. YYML68]